MDEYVIVNKSDLTSMADTIRDALGSTDSIAVSDLGVKLIESIEAGGGGGMQYETGEFTPAEDISLTAFVGIGFSCSFPARTIVIFSKKAPAKAYAFVGCTIVYNDGYIGAGYSSAFSYISAGYGSSTSSSATRGSFGIDTGTGSWAPSFELGVPIMRHYTTSTMFAGTTYKWFACERSLLYT